MDTDGAADLFNDWAAIRNEVGASGGVHKSMGGVNPGLAGNKLVTDDDVGVAGGVEGQWLVGSDAMPSGDNVWFLTRIVSGFFDFDDKVAHEG